MLVKFRNRNYVPSTWNDFDHFFGGSFANLFDSPEIKTMPAVNVKESETAFIVEMAAPGLKKEDFNVKLDKGLLEISSEKKSETNEQKDKFTRREYHFSSFKRSFTLPENVDETKIAASYNDGILSLELPKKEEAKQESKTIKIS